MLKVKVIDVKRKVITWSESVSHALDDSKGQLKTGDRKSQLNWHLKNQCPFDKYGNFLWRIYQDYLPLWSSLSIF